jgi:hypothetical protein
MPLSPHMFNPVYRLNGRSISKGVKICAEMGLEVTKAYNVQGNVALIRYF